jgi:hypothetical protein
MRLMRPLGDIKNEIRPWWDIFVISVPPPKIPIPPVTSTCGCLDANADIRIFNIRSKSLEDGDKIEFTFQPGIWKWVKCSGHWSDRGGCKAYYELDKLEVSVKALEPWVPVPYLPIRQLPSLELGTYSLTPNPHIFTESAVCALSYSSWKDFNVDKITVPLNTLWQSMKSYPIYLSKEEIKKKDPNYNVIFELHFKANIKTLCDGTRKNVEWEKREYVIVGIFG